MSDVHSTAVLDPACRIGKDVQIGAFSVIGADVEIGDRTQVGHHACILGPTQIASDCTIGHHAVLGSAPQDRTYLGEPTRVSIGAGTTLGDFVNVNRGTVKDKGETVIGAGCYLMAYSHIGHDCVIGDSVTIVNATQIGGHVEVGEGANISAVVAIGHFVRVGAYSIVSGGSALNQDVPPYGMVSGVTAQLIGINRVGLQRAGFSSEDRVAIRAAYGVLFRSEGPVEERLHSLRERFSSNQSVRRLVEFVESSSKGVCRMRRRAI